MFSIVKPSAPANVTLSTEPSLPVSLKVALEPAPVSEEILNVVSDIVLLNVISLLDLIIDSPVPDVRTISF